MSQSPVLVTSHQAPVRPTPVARRVSSLLSIISRHRSPPSVTSPHAPFLRPACRIHLHQLVPAITSKTIWEPSHEVNDWAGHRGSSSYGIMSEDDQGYQYWGTPGWCMHNQCNFFHIKHIYSWKTDRKIIMIVENGSQMVTDYDK